MWFTLSSLREAIMVNGVIHINHIPAGHVWKTCKTTRISVYLSILPSLPPSYCGLKVDRPSQCGAGAKENEWDAIFSLWQVDRTRARLYIELKGEHVTDGYAGTALSDGLTPPWGYSSSCGSVTVLNRFCSGVCHCVWHWWPIGQTLRELLSRWGVSVRKMLWLYITFHLALKPRPYLCSRSGTHSALSFIYNLLHGKGLWERTRQTVPV